MIRLFSLFAVAAAARHLPAAGGAVRLGRGGRHPLGLQRGRPARADQRPSVAARGLCAPGHRLAAATGSRAGHHAAGAGGHPHRRAGRALVFGSGVPGSRPRWHSAPATTSAPSPARCSMNCRAWSSRHSDKHRFFRFEEGGYQIIVVTPKIADQRSRPPLVPILVGFALLLVLCAYLAVRGLFRPLATIRAGRGLHRRRAFRPPHPHAAAKTNWASWPRTSTTWPARSRACSMPSASCCWA